jgi:hypothetical protein
MRRVAHSLHYYIAAVANWLCRYYILVYLWNGVVQAIETPNATWDEGMILLVTVNANLCRVWSVILVLAGLAPTLEDCYVLAECGALEGFQMGVGVEEPRLVMLNSTEPTHILWPHSSQSPFQ